MALVHEDEHVKKDVAYGEQLEHAGAELYENVSQAVHGVERLACYAVADDVRFLACERVPKIDSVGDVGTKI